MHSLSVVVPMHGLSALASQYLDISVESRAAFVAIVRLGH